MPQSSLGKLLSMSSLKDLSEVNKFATDLRFKLVELSKLDVDFQDTSSGGLFLSQLVRSKLPPFYLRELCRKTDSSYPSYTDFLDKSSELTALLNISTAASHGTKSSEHKSYKPTDRPTASHSKPVFNKPFKSSNPKEAESSQAFTRKCKFCEESHASTYCRRFPTLESRLAKLRSESRCTKCTQKGHSASNCAFDKFRPCKHCNNDGHLDFMCKTKINSISSSGDSSAGKSGSA